MNNMPDRIWLYEGGNVWLFTPVERLAPCHEYIRADALPALLEQAFLTMGDMELHLNGTAREMAEVICKVLEQEVP